MTLPTHALTASPPALAVLPTPRLSPRRRWRGAQPPSVIITGVAGFIGSELALSHLRAGDSVLGIDAFTSRDPAADLKASRLEQLQQWHGFTYAHADLSNARATVKAFERAPGALILHMAARAGVRHPKRSEFISSNLVGFANVLEAAVRIGAPHLLFASSSSVYGASAEPPFAPSARTDRPRSLYAATKICGEALACAYANEHGLNSTGLRFFNVYGPWGRPDMAPYLFTRAILEGKPIELFDHGQGLRDFTYIEDVVRCVRALESPVTGHAPVGIPYRVYNVGTGQPVRTVYLLEVLEAVLGRRAIRRLKPAVPADMPVTAADVEELKRSIGFFPSTPIEEGLARYVHWFRGYYGC